MLPALLLLLSVLGVSSYAHARPADADDLLIVHCTLPGQIRQLGQRTTYLSPRRPVRTSAQDCRVRGGEYVVSDRASLKSAIGVWLQAARAGDAEAQTTLGEIFEQGLGVPADYRSAATWYQQAAQQGHERAMINLGFLYESGLGVEKDPQRALQWYRRATGLPEAVRIEVTPDLAESTAKNQELMRLQDTIGQLREEVRRLQQALEHARAESSRPAASATVQTEAVRALESDLADRELQIQALLQELETIRTARQENRTAPALLPDLAGPSLALVEPQLPSTRGMVKVAVAASAAAAPVQKVIGRVTASAGLLSLTVNGQEVAANAAGVFASDVPVRQEATDVTIVAVDEAGKRAQLAFQLGRQPDPLQPPRLDLNLGRFHALLIGNTNYQHLPSLATPKNDVQRLRTILETRYGFQVTVLEDATRYQILSALNDLRSRLTSEDNLLVFYAGHGELDDTNMRGHWLPVDAEPTSTANWVSNVAVTDILNVMQARQVMLIVDSCYSGTLTRSSIAQLDTAMTEAERRTWLQLLASKRARVVLTSGGLAPVLDIGGGEHSVFARSLITVLDSNADLLTGRSLYQAVAAQVAHAASRYEFEQIPQYAPVARAGHEAGDFFLNPAL